MYEISAVHSRCKISSRILRLIENSVRAKLVSSSSLSRTHKATSVSFRDRSAESQIGNELFSGTTKPCNLGVGKMHSSPSFSIIGIVCLSRCVRKEIPVALEFSGRSVLTAAVDITLKTVLQFFQRSTLAYRFESFAMRECLQQKTCQLLLNLTVSQDC